jgi:hypothetical protein
MNSYNFFSPMGSVDGMTRLWLLHVGWRSRLHISQLLPTSHLDTTLTLSAHKIAHNSTHNVHFMTSPVYMPENNPTNQASKLATRPDVAQMSFARCSCTLTTTMYTSTRGVGSFECGTWPGQPLIPLHLFFYALIVIVLVLDRN